MEPLILMWCLSHYRMRVVIKTSRYRPLQAHPLIDTTNFPQILIDGNDPTRFVTTRTARTIVRQLVAGFKAEGLEFDECVCIHSFNDVRKPSIHKVSKPSSIMEIKWA